MHERISLLLLLTCAAGPIACGSTSDPADAAVGVDASQADAGMLPAGDFWSLDGVRHSSTLTRCQAAGGAYLISGSNSDRTGFSFKFLAMPPAAGTFTVEPGPGTIGTGAPASQTGVILRYSSDPAGGGQNVEHYGQSGTITLTSVGGKLHAVATAIASKETTSMSAGVIAAELTCP